MMHLHHQEIATFMKNDLKSAGALITSDQNHYMELAQGAIFSSEYLAYLKFITKSQRFFWVFSPSCYAIF